LRTPVPARRASLQTTDRRGSKRSSSSGLPSSWPTASKRDAQETAKDRLTRTEEEVRLRRLALDEREVELDHFKRDLEGARQQLIQTEQELEEQRRQLAEASREAQARLTAAGEESAATIAAASERAEALQAEAQAASRRHRCRCPDRGRGGH